MIDLLHYKATIYKSVGFTKSKNAIVDELDTYLNTRNFITFDNIAPIKLSLATKVILPLGEDLSASNPANAGRPIDGYTYLKFTSYDATRDIGTFYFWVDSIRRIANSTCEFSLTMDVLNTYGHYLLSRMSERTLIKREHLSRFNEAYKSLITSGFPKSGKLVRLINDVPEGFNPTQIKQSSQYVTTLSGSDSNYYLIYQTRDNLSADDLSNPVTCYLTSDASLLYKKQTSGPVVTLTANDLTDGLYYYIIDDGNPTSGYLTYGVIDYSFGSFVQNYGYRRGFCLTKDGSNIKMRILFTTSTDGKDYYYPDSQTISTHDSVTLNHISTYYSYYFLTTQLDLIKNSPATNVNSGVLDDIYNKYIGLVDRQDSKILKIIKLPYSPEEPIINADGEYSFDGFAFDYKKSLFYLQNISKEFENRNLSTLSLYSQSMVDLSIFVSKDSMISAEKGALGDDSKLFESEFYTLKFNYDSFSTTIPLERTLFTPVDSKYPSIGFYFKATNTINSNFAFKAVLKNMSWKHEIDYQDYILSTRNNELTIFSNSYIEYIKSGFNYDKKNKALQSVTSFAGGAMAIGTGAAMMLTGHEFSGVASIAGGAMALLNATTRAIENENNMQAKLASLKNQATQTSGSDDSDLLSYYSGNRLTISIWQASDNVRKLVNDIFYYYGYACNFMAKPDYTSRVWFNYIQADCSFNAISYLVPQDAVDSFAQSVKDGVTIYHEVIGTVDTTPQWNFSQVNENWESWILD